MAMLLKDISLQFTLERCGCDQAVEQRGREPGWQDKAAVWLARSDGGQTGPQSHMSGSSEGVSGSHREQQVAGSW